MKKTFHTILTLFFICGMTAPADAKKKPKPVVPTAQEAQAFQSDVIDAKTNGTFNDFVNDKMTNGNAKDMKMLKDVLAGKQANGEPMPEGKGFYGDPTDGGPQDWSDYNIKTDGKGNVIGFEEKDFDEKDADGDGKISDEERKDWEEKEKKENDERGGPPGQVPPVAPWDRDGDQKIDPNYVFDCWQCTLPDEALNECHDGLPGPCDGHSCSGDERCVGHVETHDGKTYQCHNCVPKETGANWCEEKGYFSQSNCNGACSAGPCIPVNVSKSDGKVVPDNVTRERNSTNVCYSCMRVDRVQIEYYIVLIETPFGRYVLNKKGTKDLFEPSSIMALAQVVPGSGGKVKNTLGELKQVTDFVTAFQSGMGPFGIPTSGGISMDQLTSLLSSKMEKGGSFGQNCFDDVVDQADENAEEQGKPTSDRIDGTHSERKRDGKLKRQPNFSEEEVKRGEAAGSPAVNGPIVVCGNEGRDKVLQIYDSTGALIDRITQEMVKLNPGIIAERLGVAQEISNFISSRIDVGSYLERFTGLPITRMQNVMSKIQRTKAMMDQVADPMRKKKKKKKKKQTALTYPNDPLFQFQGKKKRKKKKQKQVTIGANMKMGTGTMAGGGREIDKSVEAEDQYYLPVIGFTDWEDPNSAWNVVDPEEKNIVVAVIDSGFDFGHEDAPKFVWTNNQEIPDNGIDDDHNGFVDDIHGWNFIEENHNFVDIRGHGTFVAGIIAAQINNGVGIAGINPGAVIMPLVVADEEGETNNFQIYRAINYAVNHGAKVINVSLGSRGISKLEQQAIERAHQMGALVLVAAGNSNESIVDSGPSSSRYAFSIGQLDKSGERSTVSNWGPNLGLVAPGEQIYSLASRDNKHVKPSVRKFGYYKQDGTSFSTPMVAGVASLIWAKNPELTNEQVRSILLQTAADMDEEGWDAMTGAGLLNAAAALRAEVTDDVVVYFTNIRMHRSVRDKVVAVDLYGTITGDFQEFTIGVGKGKRARKFKPKLGPYNNQRNYQFLGRLEVQEHLRGSDDWIFAITVIDNEGNEHQATTPFTLPR